MNQITSFSDASNVYGSDLCEMRELRLFHGGQLNSTRYLDIFFFFKLPFFIFNYKIYFSQINLKNYNLKVQKCFAIIIKTIFLFRTFHGGKDLLPHTIENAECKSESGRCFEAGDARNSEQPVLAAIHTLFLR